MIDHPLTRRTALASGLAAFASTTILAKAPPSDITLEQDFDELWETLRDRYAFFEDKATDWERVRSLYRPKLADVGDDEEKWNTNSTTGTRTSHSRCRGYRAGPYPTFTSRMPDNVRKFARCGTDLGPSTRDWRSATKCSGSTA
jgi:hypothetical protein